MSNILDTSISCFPDYRSTEGKPVNLLAWLQSAKYADRVKTIRATSDKAVRDKLKSLLPAITPSGLFSKREAAGLIKHSGFMQIDIDGIEDIAGTKAKIISISNVAYCGLSVSGKGLWALIPITLPEHHKEYFMLIEKVFASMGIKIDPACKDVCRLRGYSYDPDAYFNHNAKILEQWYKKPIQHKKHLQPQYSSSKITDDRSKVELLINEICSRGIDLTGNYKAWFDLGCSFANEFGEDGRNYFHSVSQYHPDYSSQKTDKQFSDCLKHRYGYSIASFFGMCRDAGILFKEIAPVQNGISESHHQSGFDWCNSSEGIGVAPVAPKRIEAQSSPIEPEVKLSIDDICLVQWITYTGAEFDNLIMAWLKTGSGKNYEMIFNRDEHLLPYGEKNETVKQVEQFYKKTFQPIQFEGERVYCHIFLN